MQRFPAFCPFVFLLLVTVCGCGGTSHSNQGLPVPAAEHVFLVVMENHSFSQVIGSPAMPFLNSLADSNGLAVQFFADAHPSIPNYFVLTTGKEQTLDDQFAGVVGDDNLVRALTAAGKTWKAYIESLPAAGYTGPTTGTYLRQHNPFSFLSDVNGSGVEADNMVPLSQFSADLNAGNLASFVYLLPDSRNDAHDCPDGSAACADDDKLAAADRWLKNNVGALLNSPHFGNSLLIITFDEGALSDIVNGGGQVATVLVGPKVKQGFRSSTPFQHQSTLRLILNALMVSDMPGDADGAPSMGEFFQ